MTNQSKSIQSAKDEAEYVPFGKEWKKEVKKLPKDFIIEQWKESCIKVQELEARLKSHASALEKETDAVEPYFGWCDVEGCDNEGCSGGMAWRDTGYWTVCSMHSQMHREGKEQPKMKQTAIDKEKTRKPDGTLP